MARQQITLAIRSARANGDVTLQLDPEQMSQRIMLGDLGRNVFYEPETSHFLGGALEAGDTFVDIGAHVGYFAMLASVLVGPTGRVIAFEPNVENHAHLLEHIEANGATHVLPVHMAVGASESVAEFYVNADNDGGHALWDVGAHPFNERSRGAPRTRKVFVTSLDGFFGDRDLRRLKVIKIDTEGAEVAVLSGARALLERHRVPFVIAEVNRFGLEKMGTNEAELRAFMTALGYETYAFVPGQSHLVRLESDQYVESEYVFNVLFRHPSAPALAA